MKDLNLFKTVSKVQEASSILREGFSLSKWSHLHMGLFSNRSIYSDFICMFQIINCYEHGICPSCLSCPLGPKKSQIQKILPNIANEENWTFEAATYWKSIDINFFAKKKHWFRNHFLMGKVQLPLNCAILWPICVNQGAVMFAYWYNSSGPSIDVSHERKDYSFLQFFRNI